MARFRTGVIHWQDKMVLLSDTDGSMHGTRVSFL